MTALRVVVVADDPLVRAGLATLLDRQSECVIAGQVNSQAATPAELDLYRPDVVLWDFGWEPEQPVPAGLAAEPNQEPPRSNLDRLTELGEAGLPVVVLLPDTEQAGQAWHAGARGLLRRDADVDKLVSALVASARGLVTLEPELAVPLLPPGEPEYSPLVEALTQRELEVLQLLAEGLPNKAIARRLDISEHTVKFHVNAVMSKLSAQSRTEAVVRATRLGLILL